MAAAALRVLATSSGSATIEEANKRALLFFREVCRTLPLIIERYNLSEIITAEELRSRVADEFRKHKGASNPKVVDMLRYKGEEEFEYYVTQSKQRHHVLGKWVLGTATTTAGAVSSPLMKSEAISHRPGIVATHGESAFLRKFYESN